MRVIKYSLMTHKARKIDVLLPFSSSFLLITNILGTNPMYNFIKSKSTLFMRFAEYILAKIFWFINVKINSKSKLCNISLFLSNTFIII